MTKVRHRLLKCERSQGRIIISALILSVLGLQKVLREANMIMRILAKSKKDNIAIILF